MAHVRRADSFDAWIVDRADADAAPAIADLGIRVEAMDTIFSNPGVASNVAASALKTAASCGDERTSDPGRGT